MDHPMEWYERLKYGPNYKYQEGRIGYWKRAHFDRKCWTRTRAGFVVQYRLRGGIERVDDEAFLSARMLEDGADERLVSVFCWKVVEPCLASSGFFVLEWSGEVPEHGIIAGPIVGRYQFTKKGASIKRDFNRVDTVAKINSEEFVENGCRVYLQLMDVDVEDDLAMKNAANLSKADELAAIHADPRYSLYVENTAARAMADAAKARQHLFELMTNQTHETKQYVLQTRRVGPSVELSWKFDPSHRDQGFDLVGFRREGSYGADKWSEEENGIRVVDARSDGKCVESLDEGKTYYYTFFVRRAEACGFMWTESTTRKYGSLRFSLRIPTTSELRSAESALTRVFERRLAPRDAELSKQLEELGFFVKARRIMAETEQALIEEISKRGYEGEREEREKDAIHTYFERWRMNLMDS